MSTLVSRVDILIIGRSLSNLVWQNLYSEIFLYSYTLLFNKYRVLIFQRFVPKYLCRKWYDSLHLFKNDTVGRNWRKNECRNEIRLTIY